MNRKLKLASAIALVVGVSTFGQVSAATLAAGTYDMNILTTPEYVAGTGIPDVGCTGSVCANSSFTFGGFPSFSSQRMTDNATTVAGAGGIGGDGYAGVINFTVDGGGNLTFNSYSVDTIAGTAAGSFAQYVSDVSGMSGSIDGSGNINFTPTNRFANTSGPVITGNPWNVTDYSDNGTPTDPTDDTFSTWQPFTTGMQTGGAGNITGQALDDAMHAVLVSATAVGANWGTFAGGTYYEVWSVDITPATVPVPAAVWLFGSGLVGLVGIARRKRGKI
jgi:hypothetical protein